MEVLNSRSATSLRSIVSVLALVLGTGCVSWNDGKPDEVVQPPAITQDMPLNEALKGAIDFGGETLRRVRLLVARRAEWYAATRLLEQAIADGILTYNNAQLINALKLYQFSPHRKSAVDLFKRLVSSGRPLARQLGWQIATTSPSALMADAIDYELSRAITEDDEARLYVPEMAEAVRANRLKEAYSIVREGLMATGRQEFAGAMGNLRPELASSDLVDYLALAPVEELRQLTLASVNFYTCVVALRHLLHYPVAMNHEKFDHLFLYAVSRNQGLSELGYQVIQSYLPENQDQIALRLGRMPSWVQVAFIQGSRRRMTPVVGLLLSELKTVTTQQDVLEEIREAQR